MSPLSPLSTGPKALATPPPRWWVRASDRLSIYLPVLLMGGLALGSYWLVRNAPVPEAPAPDRPLAHEPDYFMRDFAVRTFTPEGRLLNELRGREVRHFPDTRTLEVDEARMRAFNPQGRLTTATTARLSSNADQTVYRLQGQVHVVREAHSPTNGGSQPRLEFLGETLTVDMQGDRITSEQPVQMLRGPDRINADSLRYDDRQRLADLQGRVRAVLAPRP